MEDYTDSTLNKTLTVRVTLAALFFVLVFIGGLFQIGDFSFGAIMNRLFTALVQTIFFYTISTLAFSIYAFGKEERIYGDI